MIRTYLPGVLAMAIVVVASNILVQFLCGQWLTWGAFTYPFAFLVTDLTNRTFGVRVAKKVVLAGFVVGVVCSLIGTQIVGEYGPIVTLRVAVASGTAFLVGQLMDVVVFNALRRRVWWHAPFVSSLIGSALDTIIFFSLAFAGALTFLEPGNDVAWANEMLPLLGHGPTVPLWVSLGAADWMVKMSLALVALVPYRVVVRRVVAPVA
ncbi:queuosine precursor transporter [Acidimangrovimonas pyrenivorans]|uniref:Probable queuosine precursor transporter n=1 Tax=Acidimangrovimonas pyrenivorans TaxID=2030798 RepID=A0ABV7ACM6_9RHOB